MNRDLLFDEGRSLGEDAASGIEGERRQSVQFEPGSCVSIVSGCQHTPNLPDNVNQEDIRAAGVLAPGENRKELFNLDLKSGFFADLTPDRIFRNFKGVDKTSRDRPETGERHHVAAHQKHMVAIEQKSSAGDLGIFVLDPAALRAGGALFSSLNLQLQAGSTLGAKDVRIVVMQTTAGE